ncbi:MAG: agmatine deiminase family protein [Pseudomonadota bacterium]
MLSDNSPMNLVKKTLMPEWSPQRCMWVGWPSSSVLWGPDLQLARWETSQLVAALNKCVHVRLITSGSEADKSAKFMCGPRCDVIDLPMGDIWIRDTGPVYATNDEKLIGLTFGFNGWGEKFILEGDQDIAEAMLAVDGISSLSHEIILEGGALDFDGHGTLLTTRQCMLNSNRNRDWAEDRAEDFLINAFGAKQIIWLDQGILGDHTDGHVDNLARFIGDGRVVCQRPSGTNDPNAAVFASTQKTLENAGLDIVTIPSPGLITDSTGAVMPASHLNFVIANGSIIMPIYEEIYSDMARCQLQEVMPEFEVIGLPANGLLTGGGAFHCMTQQVPSPELNR